MNGRCDSFVFETNVHYPTDINLLLDAMRKSILLTAELCKNHELSSWRQAKHNVSQIKKLMRQAQNRKKARSKVEEVREEQEDLCKEAHQKLIDASQKTLEKLEETFLTLRKKSLSLQDELLVNEIEAFMKHGVRQIEQIERRVIKEETIPHDEKVFSLFEPHTEWISKGKAGVPVEFGVKVCSLEDRHQFILHHQIMRHQADVDVCVDMVKGAKKRFPALASVSFDRGFHSKENQEELKKELPFFALPKKGKLSKQTKEAQNTEDFKKARHKHAAVESAINALEVHGLDVCPDRGFAAFERYTALAVLARNIQHLGNIIRMQQQNAERKKQRTEERKQIKRLETEHLQKSSCVTNSFSKFIKKQPLWNPHVHKLQKRGVHP